MPDRDNPELDAEVQALEDEEASPLDQVADDGLDPAGHQDTDDDDPGDFADEDQTSPLDTVEADDSGEVVLDNGDPDASDTTSDTAGSTETAADGNVDTDSSEDSAASRSQGSVADDSRGPNNGNTVAPSSPADEPDPFAGQSLTAQGLHADRDINVTQNTQNTQNIRNYLNEESSNQLVLEEIDPGEWVRLKAAFLPSASAATARAAGKALEPILVVYGPEGCGKRATAIYLAESFGYLQTDRSDAYRFRQAAEDPLQAVSDYLETLSEEGVHEISGALLVLDERSATERSSIDFDHALISQLEPKLDRAGVVLLVTSRLEPPDLPTELQLVSAQLDAGELETLLEQSLGAPLDSPGPPIDASLQQRVRSEWPDLGRLLDSPLKIRQFCRRLAEVDDPAAADLASLAADAIHLGPLRLQAWFDSLGENGQVLGYLLLFFRELSLPGMATVYSQVIQWLRSDGASALDDPRHRGIGDLLLKLRALRPGGALEFESPDYSKWLTDQAANHRLLLVSIADFLLQSTDDFKEGGNWQLRLGIGRLLGFLGSLDRPWLRQRLRALSASREWAHNRVASYALVHIAAGDLSRRSDWAMKLLRDWVGSKSVPVRSTAGLTLRQLHQSLPSFAPRELADSAREVRKEALALIRKMARAPWSGNIRRQAQDEARRRLPHWRGANPPRSIADATTRILIGWRESIVIPALEPLLRTDPAGVAPEVADWMQDKRLQRLARMVARRSLSKPSRRHLEAVGPILSGVVRSATITTGSGTVFSSLPRWIAREDLRDELLQSLLQLAAGLGSKERMRLRNALAEACRNTPDERRLTARVSSRLHSFEGQLVGPPAVGTGLLVLDSAALDDARHELLVHNLRALLSARLRLRTGALGRVRSWSEDEKIDPRLLTHHPHRFLLPAIEEASKWAPDVIVVLVAGPVLDLADLVDGVAHQNVLFVDLQGSTDEVEGLEFWRVPERVSEETLLELEEGLDRFWNRGMANMAPAAWRPLIDPLGLDLRAAPSDLEQQLAAWAVRINELEHAEPESDLVRRLCAAFAAWAALDLPACVETLARWLNTPEEGKPEVDPRQSDVAVAAAKTLYRLHAESLLALRPELALLFEGLAASLSRRDHDGAGTVLRALRQWLRDEAWTEYLAGDVRDGRSRLLRWAEEFLPGRVEEFERLLTAPEEEDEEDEAAHLRDPLRSFLEEPRFEHLPALESDQRYGLIAVDDLAPKAFGDAALSLAHEWRRSPLPVVPAIFQLGRSQPVWVPESPWRPAALRARPTRLLGPLLERRELTLDNVAFVLVLCSGPILDAADWHTSGWWRRVLVHMPRKQLDMMLFTSLAVPNQERKDRAAFASFLYGSLLEQLKHRDEALVTSATSGGTS